MGIDFDEEITTNILKSFSRGNIGDIDLATGYLNLTNTYKALLSSARGPCSARIITASPVRSKYLYLRIDDIFKCFLYKYDVLLCVRNQTVFIQLQGSPQVFQCFILRSRRISMSK